MALFDKDKISFMKTYLQFLLNFVAEAANDQTNSQVTYMHHAYTASQCTIAYVKSWVAQGRIGKIPFALW